MAQWLGYGSGHTHATRVEDAEAALRHAVEVHRGTNSEDERSTKAKVVKRLAENLMRARLRLVKARLAAVHEAQMGGVLARRTREIATLQHREVAIRDGGTSAILAEFGASDADDSGKGG